MDIKSAFHQFDIRGIYPEVLDEHLAFLVGSNALKFIGSKNLCIAGDQNNSSPRIKTAIIDGVKSLGGEIADLGNLPTPLLYYAIAKGYFAGGFEVTASHLAATQNGIKIVGQKAIPLNEQEVLDLKKLVETDKENYLPSTYQPINKEMHEKLVFDYIKEISGRFANLKFPGLLIFDTGQTLFTPIIKTVLEKLSLKSKILALPRDLNPLEYKSRRHLIEEIKNSHAALGFIWDGDGDRCIVLDEKGVIVPPTFIAALVAKNFEKVAYDVRLGTAAYVTEKVVLPSWAQNLKYAMQADEKIGFACENTGHTIYREWYLLDDGLFAALKFLEVLTKIDATTELEKLKNKFYEAEEENFPIKEDTAMTLEKIADYYRAKDFIVHIIDGVTVVGTDFKINLRPSATEPLLRLNLEARNESQADKLREEIVKLIG